MHLSQLSTNHFENENNTTLDKSIALLEDELESLENSTGETSILGLSP